MKDRVFFSQLFVLILSLLMMDQAYGADILIHDAGIDEGIIYSVSPDGSNVKKIGDGIFPQWSPDRKLISYIKKDTTCDCTKLMVVNKEGKEVFNVIEPIDKGIITYHTWDPKGQGIALIKYDGSESSVAYYDIKTRRIRTLHTAKFESAEEPLLFLSMTLEWSPDGERLLFYGLRNVDLIDPKKGTVTKLIDVGFFPRFIGKEKVLFVINSEIWSINIDGSDKRKLQDMGMPILSVTKESRGKIILLAMPKYLPGEPPLRLFLLNLKNNKLEEIKTQGYAFVLPEISPDGSKFAAIGSKWSEAEAGDEDKFYVFDLKTQQITFLKKVESGGSRGLEMFLFGKPIVWR